VRVDAIRRSKVKLGVQPAGGQRIALQVNGVVRWLATDHPSASVRLRLRRAQSSRSRRRLRACPERSRRGWPRLHRIDPGQRGEPAEHQHRDSVLPLRRAALHCRRDADDLHPFDRLRAGFTGQRRDSGSGLLYYGARWYDPALGRFAQGDTIVPNPGNPQSLNRYSYVGNQPLKLVDPSGHRPECGVQGGECNNDTYYAGFSVLDRRPWVQAYLADQMDGRHFGEIILAGIIGNAIGNVVGQAVGDLFGIGAPQIQVGAGQSSLRTSDAIGDPGFGPTALSSTARLLPSNEVRQWYSDRARKIDTSGPPTRELAEQVHAQRNALKAQARSMMVDQAAASQLDKDFPIRDFAYYVNKYSAQGYTGTDLWKRIIQGSATPNQAVNDRFGIK